MGVQLTRDYAIGVVPCQDCDGKQIFRVRYRRAGGFRLWRFLKECRVDTDHYCAPIPTMVKVERQEYEEAAAIVRLLNTEQLLNNWENGAEAKAWEYWWGVPPADATVPDNYGKVW